MARKLSLSSSESVSELGTRIELLERQAREQQEALRIQFTRIAQMQAELDQLHAKKDMVKAEPAKSTRARGAA